MGPDPWNNIPDLLEASWLRGVRPTVFLIGRNAHPLDGTPRRTYERERPALAAAVRAAGAEVGLHASFGSSEDGGRAGVRAGRPARRGGRDRGRPLPLPALPLPPDGALAGGGGRRVRLEPRLQRGAGVRGGHRPALPALSDRRGAPGPAHAAAAGRDGHHPPLAPEARRRGGPRPRPGRARPGARLRGPGRPAVAQHVPQRRARARVRAALGRSARRAHRTGGHPRPRRHARPRRPPENASPAGASCT